MNKQNLTRGTQAKAAEALNVHPSTVSRHVSAGKDSAVTKTTAEVQLQRDIKDNIINCLNNPGGLKNDV